MKDIGDILRDRYYDVFRATGKWPLEMEVTLGEAKDFVRKLISMQCYSVKPNDFEDAMKYIHSGEEILMYKGVPLTIEKAATGAPE